MFDLIQQFIQVAESLSPVELWLVIALDFLLVLLLIYRILGIGAVLGFLLLIFFAYILYSNNIFEIYRRDREAKAVRMEIINNELKKNDLKD